ncbi:hypothetical protein [Methanobrevibacter sp.]
MERVKGFEPSTSTLARSLETPLSFIPQGTQRIIMIDFCCFLHTNNIITQ